MCETKNFYLWLLQIIALLGLLVLCLWLSLLPKQPKYTIVNISAPNTSTPDQSGTISYELYIDNPNNDYNILYDDIFLAFYYGQNSMGDEKFDSFKQGKGKSAQLRGSIKADPSVWKGFHNAMSHATAELKVSLSTNIQYKFWGSKSKHHGMKMEGRVKIGSDGKILGKKKKIKLKHATKKLRSKASRFH